MQIPSSLASIVSYWFPNLGDTEKKAQGGKTPDLCNLSLDQVLQIYKQQDICPVGADGSDSSPQFIRELEQTSWQQKQMTSGIFHHIDSMTTDMNRISGRLDKLEPEILRLALPAFVVFLTFTVGASIFLLRKFKNFESELAALRKNQTDESGSSTLLINNLARTVREIEDKLSFQATQIHELSLKIKGKQTAFAYFEEKQSKLMATLEDNLSKLVLDLANIQATQDTEFNQLTMKIKDFQNELTAVKIEITSKLQEEKSITAEQIENIESTLQVLVEAVQELAAQEEGEESPSSTPIPGMADELSRRTRIDQLVNRLRSRSRTSSGGSWSGSLGSTSEGSLNGSPPLQ